MLLDSLVNTPFVEFVSAIDMCRTEVACKRVYVGLANVPHVMTHKVFAWHFLEFFKFTVATQRRFENTYYQIMSVRACMDSHRRWVNHSKEALRLMRRQYEVLCGTISQTVSTAIDQYSHRISLSADVLPSACIGNLIRPLPTMTLPFTDQRLRDEKVFVLWVGDDRRRCGVVESTLCDYFQTTWVRLSDRCLALSSEQ